MECDHGEGPFDMGPLHGPDVNNRMRHLWNLENNQPFTIMESAQKFKLDNREYRVIETMTNSIPDS